MAFRVLGWALRAWAVVQAVAAVLWVVGPYGTANLYSDHLPGWLERTLDPLLSGLFTGPMIGAYLTEPGVMGRLADMSGQLTGAYPVGEVHGAFGDINVGWNVQFSVLTSGQGVAWTALHVVPLLTMAVLWWLLGGMAARGRGTTPFTSHNALLLTIAGGVVLAGAPLASLLTWWFYTRIADSSQLADRIQVPSYSWGHLPWTAMAAGFALVVLGQVWRRGVAMENELGGLV